MYTGQLFRALKQKYIAIIEEERMNMIVLFNSPIIDNISIIDKLNKHLTLLKDAEEKILVLDITI